MDQTQPGDGKVHDVRVDYGGRRYTCRSCPGVIGTTCLRAEYMTDAAAWAKMLAAWREQHPFEMAGRWPGE